MVPRNMKRRNFLKGTFGVTVALPFMESFFTSEAHADALDKRFGIFIRQPTGVITENFWPAEAGAITSDMIKNTSLSPLQSVASQILVIRGIAFRDRFADTQSNGCHHASGMAQLFTGTSARRAGDGQDNITATGESLDNRIAREIDHQPPLILWAHGTGNNRAMLSFAANGALQSGAYKRPYSAYQSMFSSSAMPVSDARKLLRTSAIDYVQSELKDLKASQMLSAADRARLDAHLTLVRETEIKIAKLSDDQLKNLKDRGDVDNASNNNDSIQAIVKLHMDIAVLAVATGRKAVSLQIGDVINQITYSNGRPSQHENTHGPQSSDTIKAQTSYDALHYDLFRYLAESLNTVKIGSKSLLDYGFAVMGSEVGDGRAHSFKDIPIVIAGSANGALKQGQFVKLEDTRNTKLLNTLGAALGLKNAAGAPLDDFGDTSDYVLKNGNTVNDSGVSADFKGSIAAIKA
ncbi:MAG: DUF1552 domain-containing protein [Chitinophagaceae bacterium]|nr:DUF1552 domain-containing protein [Oligoflexus sp.]